MERTKTMMVLPFYFSQWNLSQNTGYYVLEMSWDAISLIVPVPIQATSLSQKQSHWWAPLEEWDPGNRGHCQVICKSLLSLCMKLGVTGRAWRQARNASVSDKGQPGWCTSPAGQAEPYRLEPHMHQLQEVGKLGKLGGAAEWIHRPVTVTCQSGELAHHALHKLSQRLLYMNLLGSITTSLLPC